MSSFGRKLNRQVVRTRPVEEIEGTDETGTAKAQTPPPPVAPKTTQPTFAPERKGTPQRVRSRRAGSK